MSGLDQPIVIANSCYHVGHERSWRAAEGQGFVKEEGLDGYVYERGGLIPGKWEFEGLGRQMWERGVDIATAVDVRAAVLQRVRGEDVYIVGGWRTQLAPKLIAAKGITRPEQLRGTRTVVRETWDLRYISISGTLRKFGIDPERDIEWIERPHTAYGNEPNAGDLLRSGQVTLISLNGREADQLVSEGYPLVLDLEEYYKGLEAWPPGKVIVATEQTVEHRGEELRAFLRATVRGFWFAQDPLNHSYMYALETGMRQTTFNETERRVRQLRTGTPPPPREGPMGGNFVLDGLVPRPALAAVIQDMVQSGEIEHSTELDDVLKDAASIDAFNQLLSRGLINREALDEWRQVKGVKAAS